MSAGTIVRTVTLSDDEASALFAAFGRLHVRRYSCGCSVYFDVDTRRWTADRACAGHAR